MMNKSLDEILAYINAAPTPEERRKRKTQMYCYIYNNPRPLHKLMNDKGELK